MTLVNVRLEAEDARRVKALREAGVVISALVREAIRAEYEKRVAPRAGRRRPSEVVEEILAALPDDGTIPPPVDATDRRAVREHIAARLRRKR